MIRVGLIILSMSVPAFADTVIAARTIPAKALIGPADVVLNGQTIPGAVSNPAAVVGMEARVALYAGRPIRAADVQRPASVERNQLLTLYFQHDGLIISTDGRALGRAGPGDQVRVMNLTSRTTVSATIGEDGAAYVQR